MNCRDDIRLCHNFGTDYQLCLLIRVFLRQLGKLGCLVSGKSQMDNNGIMPTPNSVGVNLCRDSKVGCRKLEMWLAGINGNLGQTIGSGALCLMRARRNE